MSHMNAPRNTIKGIFFISSVTGMSQAAFAENSNQTRYTISAITTNQSSSFNSGSLQMWANSINNLGQIVGGEMRRNANGENYVAAYLLHNNQLTYLNFGDLNSDARDINDVGQIIGDAWGEAVHVSSLYDGRANIGETWRETLSLPSRKAVLFDNNAITVLDTSNVFNEPRGAVRATDINNRGDITGAQDLGNLTTGTFKGIAPVVFKNGIATPVDVSGSAQSPTPFYETNVAEATAINDKGELVGYGNADPISFMENAYLLADGKIELFSLFQYGGGVHAYGSASDINNHRQVVGKAQGSYNEQYSEFAFIYGDGVITNLGTFDGLADSSDWSSSAALAINDKGQVVGYATSPLHDGSDAAFLYENGTMINLNDYLNPTLGWQLTSADDINDLGQIIGVGLKNGVLTSYLLTPTELTQVPLPATVWLFGSGLAAFLAAIRKRKHQNNNALQFAA